VAEWFGLSIDRPHETEIKLRDLPDRRYQDRANEYHGEPHQNLSIRTWKTKSTSRQHHTTLACVCVCC
jgi:hypothetical protein